MKRIKNIFNNIVKNKTLFSVILVLLSTVIIYIILSLLRKDYDLELISYAFQRLNILKFIEFLIKYTLFETNFIINFLLILACTLTIYGISGRLRMSIGISALLLFLFGIINYELILIRATPFTPADFASVFFATELVGNYKIEITVQMVYSFIILILLLIILFVIKKIKISKKVRIIYRISALIIASTIFVLFFTTNIFKVSNDWNTTTFYNKNGFLVSFFQTLKNMNIEKPEDYDVSKIENHINNMLGDDNYEKQEDEPNIIIIMNESLSDLEQVYDLELKEDVMPFIHSLSKNTIKGNVHSSSIGCKTANCEFELLTGDTVRFLPQNMVAYQNYIKSKTTSLATTLSSQGYSTSVYHPYLRTGYSRAVVYPLLGFERFEAMDTLENLNYVRYGQYADDLSTYKNIIKLFEQKESNEKIFNFTITMQNHSPYLDMKLNDETYLKNYSDKEYPEINKYLSLMKLSDDAFKYLVEYFENIDEKTIIVMFGDHQPSFVNTNESVFGVKRGSYNEKNFITPFILWANYDIEEKDIGDISMNYLSTYILKVTNLQLTPYNEFLYEVYKKYPVITTNTVINSKGEVLTEEEINNIEILNTYKNIQYNHLFDNKNKINYLFEVSN